MNERIQKLYDQADKFAKENLTQTITGPGNNYFEIFHEKFAELIVAQCARVAEKAVHNDNEFRCMYDILTEHFGVEE
tara:strand:- start:227 stop:457 length:231 start_codon:yes stop_codon:yes gene_type:complete